MLNITNDTQLLLTILGVVCFLIFLFILMREFVTWYWKINRITELLEMIEENTRPKELTERLKKDEDLLS